MSDGALLFDDLAQEENYARTSKPIWTMDLDDPNNEEDIKRWLLSEFHFIKDKNEERFRQMQRNLMLYKGIQYLEQDRADIRERGQDRHRTVRKIVANHIYDLVQTRVSRLIKFKPAVSILPTNDEFSDRAAATATEQLLDHIWYTNNFEGVVSLELAKMKCVLGEAYCFISWDPNLGDLHPDYKKLGKAKIPLLDENGEQEKDDKGNPIFIDRPIRVGDVKYEVESPFNVFLEYKHFMKDVNYCFRTKLLTLSEARARWPKKAEKIKANDSGYFFDFNASQMQPLKDRIVIYEFYHKRHDMMDKGRFITFTDFGILSNKEFPYDHDDLPFVRLTDIEIPHELHGKSGIENVKQLTSTFNNLLNMAVQAHILCSYPKWMMPAGSAKKEQLGNDTTIVEFKGPTPPQLVQAEPVSQGFYGFMNSVKEQFQQIYGIFGTSRGEPPPGVTSGVALQFLSEQETERFNEDILRFTEAIRAVAKQTISVAGSYYDATDKRMLRVLGQNKEWTTEFFDVANLNKDYDIRVQNTSALPQTKAARMQTLIDLQKMFPNQFPPEIFLDMFDLAEKDKYISASTENVRTAEAENEMILNNKTEGRPMDPQPQEDHVIHWKTHVRQTQGFTFKFHTPKEIQDQMIDMIRAHEMYMVEYAQKNPAYAQQLAQLAGFPLFYHAPSPETSQQGAQLAQGQPAAGDQPMAPEQGAPVQSPGQQPVQTPGEPVQGDMQIKPALQPQADRVEKQPPPTQ